MTYEAFWRPLTEIYATGEAKAVAQFVMELHFGLSLTEVLCGKAETLDEQELRDIQQRLLKGEPVQYVIGKAEFGPRIFHVEPGVLIPRPETYELCQWVMDKRGERREERGEGKEKRGKTKEERGERILDMGTGSGCIACTLAAEWPSAEVTAWDISEEALRIAAENAKRTNVHVTFQQKDILHLSANEEAFDIIISNPPYIKEAERDAMSQNVLEHEPSLALFVPDDDPLLFYRAIAQYAQKALKPGGSLFFEINPHHAADMQELLCAMSFSDIEIRTDQYGKNRMIYACR